jgi:hypothetical protein
LRAKQVFGGAGFYDNWKIALVKFRKILLPANGHCARHGASELLRNLLKSSFVEQIAQTLVLGKSDLERLFQACAISRYRADLNVAPEKEDGAVIETLSQGQQIIDQSWSNDISYEKRLR